jgi:hypothetical protein
MDRSGKRNSFHYDLRGTAGKNHLARSDVADRLFETFIHRNQIGVWLVHFGLLTPDHLHLLVSLPQSGKRLKTIVSKWKE